jgi:molybdopterin converting factor small subunit
MRLTVRYFAAFRDATGHAAEQLDSEAVTAADRECSRRHPGLHHEAAALVAVNDEMSGWDVTLADGDEVLFFPPVAGG